jgi:diaminopimelate decarboxylase
MHLLDIGGGYPGSSDSGDLFNSIAKEINRALDEYFPNDLFAEINGTEDNKLKIIAEPGRYYACSAFTLCVNIIAKRVMNQSPLQQQQDKEAILAKKTQSVDPELIDASKSIMYYINDGIFASFNCIIFDHAECTPILIKDSPEKSILYKSCLWGPTCDAIDLVTKEIYFPELETGEFLMFKNMGAYTLSAAVPFNGIPLPRSIYFVSISWNTIKYAFEDIFDCGLQNEADLSDYI